MHRHPCTSLGPEVPWMTWANNNRTQYKNPHSDQRRLGFYFFLFFFCFFCFFFGLSWFDTHSCVFPTLKTSHLFATPNSIFDSWRLPLVCNSDSFFRLLKTPHLLATPNPILPKLQIQRKWWVAATIVVTIIRQSKLAKSSPSNDLFLYFESCEYKKKGQVQQ